MAQQTLDYKSFVWRMHLALVGQDGTWQHWDQTGVGNKHHKSTAHLSKCSQIWFNRSMLFSSIGSVSLGYSPFTILSSQHIFIHRNEMSLWKAPGWQRWIFASSVTLSYAK